MYRAAAVGAEPSRHTQPEIYFYRNCKWFRRYIRTREPGYSLTAGRAETGATGFYASTQNKSLRYAEHAAPAQTLFRLRSTLEFIGP